MSSEITFLDYNATAPISQVAKAAFNEAMALPYNPSSVHNYGRKAKSLLDKSRKNILKNIGAEGATIIFTSSGTEANNTALKAIKETNSLLVSSIEHHSILEPARKLNAEIIQVNSSGALNLEDLENKLEKNSTSGKTTLVSVILANNETGVIQNIKEISELTLKYKGYLHTDASQALGKIKLDFNNLGCDMMTISGHKLGAGFGTAGLVVKSGINIEPLIYGGGQEKYMRGGTENLPAICAFASTITEAVDNLEGFQSKTLELKTLLETGLKKIDESILIFSEKSSRLNNTTCFYSSILNSETQLIKYDLDKIAVSSGSACSSGRVSKSHVIENMGFKDEMSKNTIRVSTGWNSKRDDILKFLDEFAKLFAKKHLKKAV